MALLLIVRLISGIFRPSNIRILDMSIQDLKSELSKLERAELLDVLQYGLEVIKEMEDSSSDTPDWLKDELLSRAQQIKSSQEQTYSWEEVKNYAKASNA